MSLWGRLSLFKILGPRLVADRTLLPDASVSTGIGAAGERGDPNIIGIRARESLQGPPRINLTTKRKRRVALRMTTHLKGFWAFEKPRPSALWRIPSGARSLAGEVSAA